MHNFTNPKNQKEKNTLTHMYHSFWQQSSIEAIKLRKIFSSPDVISLLPFNIQTKGNNQTTVTYKTSKATHNNMLNYKEAVNEIYIDEEIVFSISTDQCDCTSSNFCSPYHKCIVT